MINVLVSGCNGRMGKEVINEIDNFENLLFVGGFDFYDKGQNAFKVYTSLQDVPNNIDVIIDFSHPDVTLALLETAIQKQIAMVIATTGFSKEQLKKIEHASKHVPIYQSYNMSYSIHLMSKIVSYLAKSLSDVDIEILETHHHNKIDAPSGTALLLADAIHSALNSPMKYVYNRNASTKKRSSNEIGISSIRGGNIVGEHSVFFFGEHETLEIKHTSYSRKLFAQGALKIAQQIWN